MKLNHKHPLFLLGLRSIVLFFSFFVICVFFCFVLDKTSFLFLLFTLLIGFLWLTYEKPINTNHYRFQVLFQLLLFSFLGLLGIAKLFFATNLLFHEIIMVYGHVLFLGLCTTQCAKSLSFKTNRPIFFKELKTTFLFYLRSFLLSLCLCIAGLSLCFFFLYNTPLCILMLTMYSFFVHFFF